MKDEQQGVEERRCVKVTCYIRGWTEGAFGGREPFDWRPTFNSHFEASIGALPAAAPQWAGFLEYPNAPLSLSLSLSLSLYYTHTETNTCMLVHATGKKMKDRCDNIKRQITFSHSEEAIQDVSSGTSFISDSNSVPQLSCLLDFTQTQNPDV